jgi:Na+:H+ antiporter, NhaA family
VTDVDASPRSWSESERFVPRLVVRPALELFQVEAAGGVVMLAAAVIALVWANSDWHEGYEQFWTTDLSIHLGSLAHIDLDLRGWVSDGLMAIFFLVVGLEIKRELVAGELSDPRAASLPVLAALGGMLVPAAIFVLFNAGGAGSDGWGIPMATDIAFAAGVASLLGSRVPTGAKLFLLTLAVADDLGAIVVIAIFYTTDLSMGWLAIAIGCVGMAALFKRADVRSLVPFTVLGIACWFALHESGVHATLAGVAFGLLCPAYSFYDADRFGPRARALTDRIVDGRGEDRAHMRDLGRLAMESEPPLDRIVDKLGPWVSFVIVPLFALANAGVRLSGDVLGDAVSDPVVMGVALGLLLGKPIGIVAATWIAVRTGIGRLPDRTGWPLIAALGVCAGIGFTVALFVAGLSFDDPLLTDQAKIGILGASTIAGILGYAALRATTRPAVPASSAGAEPVLSKGPVSTHG